MRVLRRKSRRPVRAGELIDHIQAIHRERGAGISRDMARERLCAMPGGMELVYGLDPELSRLADELGADDEESE